MYDSPCSLKEVTRTACCWERVVVKLRAYIFRGESANNSDCFTQLDTYHVARSTSTFVFSSVAPSYSTVWLALVDLAENRSISHVRTT